MSDFNDYATMLIAIEQKTKALENKCLNKSYAGFTADIQTIQSQLTLLTMWITQAQCEQVRENTYRILNKV
jgi:flagellar biosynthesis chaperone FliJ